jgi:hypothetical protein
MNIVTCGQCSNYRYPEKQYEPNSMGFCTYFDNWLDKFNGKKPTPKQYDDAYKMLGNKIWFPLVERDCKKYTEKIDEKNRLDKKIE